MSVSRNDPARRRVFSRRDLGIASVAGAAALIGARDADPASAADRPLAHALRELSASNGPVTKGYHHLGPTGQLIALKRNIAAYPQVSEEHMLSVVDNVPLYDSSGGNFPPVNPEMVIGSVSAPSFLGFIASPDDAGKDMPRLGFMSRFDTTNSYGSTLSFHYWIAGVYLP